MRQHEDKGKGWAKQMELTIDASHAVDPSLGTAGFIRAELDAIAPRVDVVKKEFYTKADAGEYGFPALPADTDQVATAAQLGRQLEAEFDDLVLLGIGGSALGPRALLRALGHPLHNMLERKVRGPGLRLHARRPRLQLGQRRRRPALCLPDRRKSVRHRREGWIPLRERALIPA